MEREPLFDRRHYKALCKAAHKYWCSGGPDLSGHLVQVLADFENFSGARFRRMWERLCKKESNNDVSAE